MSMYCIGAISVSLIFNGVCMGQDRVATYWNSPVSGMFEDEALWSGGVPNNSPDNLFDVIINSVGKSHTIHWESNFGTPDFVLQTLKLNSTDSILELEDQNYGNMYINESMNITAGMLRLKNSSLIGIKPHTRMDIGLGARFEFVTNGSSSHVNSLSNFDVYGGDLVVDSYTELIITGTHIMEGDLVIRGALVTESTIDFDIRFENGGLLITHVDGLEILEGVTVSGIGIGLSPEWGRFPDFDPASFINRGTIRHDGGESRITYTQNFGLVDVVSGQMDWRGDNEGTILVKSGASLFTKVWDNGVDLFFHNSGLIDVSGEGARYEVKGSFFFDDNPSQDYWSNSGTLRVTDHAFARLGSLNIRDFGTFERDETARIEITGQINLDGTIIDSNTFQGETWLTYDNPGGSGGDRGEITDGTIDLTGDWLKFSQYYGFVSNTAFVGGDLYINPDSEGIRSSQVVLDDISIKDGGIILGKFGHVGFGEQDFEDRVSFYNSSITTDHAVGDQSRVRLHRAKLHLGTAAYISGNLDLGYASSSPNDIYNEGHIFLAAGSGRLDIMTAVENHGTIASEGNSRMSFQTLNNFGILRLDNASVTGGTIVNESVIKLVGQSVLSVNGSVTLLEKSELSINAAHFRSSINTLRAFEFNGILSLDLSEISENGTYQLFEAQSFLGDFDTINVTGLGDSLYFAGFDAIIGAYTVACTADLTHDGILDFFDVGDFLVAFMNEDPIADFSDDGIFDFTDVSVFLNAFSAGCP